MVIYINHQRIFDSYFNKNALQTNKFNKKEENTC
jgi:hypothetical protein